MDYKIADRLIELRKQNGFTQGTLSEKLNISRQAISKWECGESLPDTENLIALGKLYNISLDEIINGVKKSDEPHIILPSFKVQKVLNVIKYILLAIGAVFILTGVGCFCGLAVPEISNYYFSKNENIQVESAEIVDTKITSSSIGNETLYKIVFEHEGKRYNSNPVYTKQEAMEMIGKTIEVRVSDDRVVMVDYKYSVYHTVGVVFIIVFGSIGAISTLSFVAIQIIIKKKNKD
ncbi:helix-turn-helix domain-containing protein [Acholeplasma sp. OttesenSCG-928-E16]|nr:helix-turn-helix domain-containing protein [Acholeplasma sp. OttesenSCG-928-E16]